MPLALSLLATATTLAAAPEVIPSHYEAGHFYATPETDDGQRLRLVIDTGGGGGMGLYWLTGTAAKRLHLATTTCTAGKSGPTVARLPHYKPGLGLPPPLSGCGPVVLVNMQVDRKDADGDGQLGAGYLPGRVWTFDYPAHRFVLEGAGWRPDPRAHATRLGFPRDGQAHPTAGFPRITLHVDGRPLDLLLDTGATAHPTPAGQRASGTPTVNGFGVASYITSAMLERWHRAHPDWRVVGQGDDLLGPKRVMRLIEVPRVEIAGWTVGPVWFTERPDPAFHHFMSSMMDKPVEGAVGGNVFEHFVMTIDYPGAVAYFRCASGCEAAK